MSRIKCPKCNKLLDEVIRVIQVRCRFDEEADDYLTDRDEGFTDLCPECKTELEEAYPMVPFRGHIWMRLGRFIKMGEDNVKSSHAFT